MILLFYFLSFFGLTGLFIGILIYLLVLYPEKGERLGGWLAKFVAWTGKKAEKTTTAMSIQGKVGSFIRSINTEVEGLLPYQLKIKWMPSDITREAFIRKDKVVVMFSYHYNQDENLSIATLLYMNKAVIPEARPHIHYKLTDAIDLMMTKKALFSFIEARSSLGHFLKTVLIPKTQKDLELKEFCSIIDSIDQEGLFTRVLLRELLELGRRQSGIIETGDTVFETSEFTKLLKQIAEKEKGVDINPTFIKNNIRVAIILVGRIENIGFSEPYLRAIEERIKKSVRTFYIFSRGRVNINFAKEIVRICEGKFKELAKIHSEEFSAKKDGVIIDEYCAILHNRKAL